MEDKQLAEHLRLYHLGEANAATNKELETTFSVTCSTVRHIPQ